MPISTPAARTHKSTSSSPATGASMSLSSRMSAEPYASWTMAFIVALRVFVVSSVSVIAVSFCR
jgi:hypothetical protein